MRQPKHVVPDVGFQSNINESIRFGYLGKFKANTYIPLDAEYSKDPFFYDTDRGLEDINDCVHAKVVESNLLPKHKPYSFIFRDSPTPNYLRASGVLHEPHRLGGISDYTTWTDIPLSGSANHLYIFYSDIVDIFDREKLPVQFWTHIQVSWAQNKTVYYPTDFVQWFGYKIIDSTSNPNIARLERSKIVTVNYRRQGAKPIMPGQLLTYDSTCTGGGVVPDYLYFGYYQCESLAFWDDYRKLFHDIYKTLGAKNLSLFAKLCSYKIGYSITKPVYEVSEDSLIQPQGYNFMFSEDITIPNHLSDIATGNRNIYWKNWLVQHAYLDALQSVPRLNDNSISNILEITSFIKSVVVDHRIEFPKRIQDLWLSYRYSYSTTKLDLHEAIKFMKRYVDLGTLDKTLTSYGLARTEVGGIPVSCTCSLKIEPTVMGPLGKIWRALDTYGLKPDFYVIWDMIPYSFIVDWLIPVGDVLTVLDSTGEFSPEKYKIFDVCFSLNYTRTYPSSPYTIKYYARWKSEPLDSLNGLYWLDKDGPSTKTKLFRILDAGSLIL